MSAPAVGSRVIIHRPFSGIDGWYGTVDAVSPQDVVVRLDRPTVWGRLISLTPQEVFPAPPGE